MTSQSEIKYKRLMEKAETLFTEYGYKSVSMNQIAEEAGISKMTIYKYFPTKEELFISILQSMADKLYKSIKDRLEKAEGTIEKIDKLLNYGIENSKHYSLVFYKDVMENPIIAEMLLKEKKRMGIEILVNILRDGKERGEIRDIDEKFISHILVALIDGTISNLVNNMDDMKEIEDFTNNFYDFLKYGLLGGKGVN